MRTAELITVTYLGYLLVAAILRGMRPAARTSLLAGTAATGALVGAMVLAPPSAALNFLRDWLPAVYVLAGYWLSGTLFIAPDERIETYLSRSDRQVFAALGLDRRIENAPGWLLECFELAYLSCYVLPAAGFAWVSFTEGSEAGDRFWSMVLLAEFISYGMLPWIQTRPPRTVETHAAIDRRSVHVRRFNMFILRRGSVQVNTVPSGHAAGAFATALALVSNSPAVAAVVGFVALGVAMGSVVGRYHYTIDSVLGTLVAVAVWAVIG